ncbi:DNA polymerase III subunit beta [Mycoplasma leonicaptivi]|uniref:DNA polymerase III subunit beta n=1 Tax=Mycoplasma leonicaptivi TaxID=36742 RepID=UPI00048320CD|nr:DNA polymerase III subunit beta [Mycoplasma leonicaptivi]
MKFIINKKIIEETVDFLSTFVDSNDAFLPFRSIYISLNEYELTLMTANSNSAAKKVIKVDEKDLKIDQVGKTLLNISILKNILKKFDNEVTFSMNSQGIDIFENKTRYTLTTSDVSGFDSLDFSTGNNIYEINSQEFYKKLNNVYVACGIRNDKSNSSLTNNLITKTINLTSESNGIRFVATDTFRLATDFLELDINEKININLDAKNIKKIITKELPEKVQFYIKEDKVGLVYDNTVVYTNIIKFSYVDISPFLNMSNEQIVKIKKNEVLKILNKTIFYSTEKMNKIQFSISNSEIKSKYEIPEIGVSDFFTNNFEYSGKTIDIDVDYTFIKDAVGTFETEELIFNISYKLDKIYITSENEKNLLHIITPFRRY